MIFYRNLLIGFTVAALAMPIFADDTATPGANQSQYNQSQQSASTNTIELTENGPVTTEAPETTEEAKPATTSSDTATPAAAPAAEAKVNLNKATVKELIKVEGLNAAKAKAIVAYRKKQGDFKTVDDLSQVKGFKKMKADELKKITDQLEI